MSVYFGAQNPNGETTYSFKNYCITQIGVTTLSRLCLLLQSNQIAYLIKLWQVCKNYKSLKILKAILATSNNLRVTPSLQKTLEKEQDCGAKREQALTLGRVTLHEIYFLHPFIILLTVRVQ